MFLKLNKKNKEKGFKNLVDINKVIASMTLGFSPLPSSSPSGLVLKTDRKMQVQKADNIVVSLSSGIDSHFVLHQLRKEFPYKKIKCLILKFKGTSRDMDETETAKARAREYDCDYHVVEDIDPLDEFDDALRLVKEPRWNLYSYQMCKYAKQDLDADLIVTGDGGDELFAGYTDKYPRIFGQLSQLPINIRFDHARVDYNTRKRIYVNSFMDGEYEVDCEKEIFQKEFHFKASRIIEKYFKKYLMSYKATTMVDLFLNCNLNGQFLNDVIPTMQKFSRHFGMDYCPYMWNYENYYWSTSLPWYLKYDMMTNMGKLPLRKILDRFDDARKIRFTINLQDLFFRNYESPVVDYISRKKKELTAIVRPEWLDRICYNPSSRKNISDVMKCYALAMLLD